MKRHHLAYAGIFFLGMASCSNTAPTVTPGAGGDASGGTTGSGGDASGGTTGSGGDATGGTTGSGGDATGGTTGSGGSAAGASGGAGKGGAVGSGGSAGSGAGGGGTSGAAGSGTGGSSTGGSGVGGSGTGGGAAGRGGSSAGGRGGTGTAGTGGSAGSGGTTGAGGAAGAGVGIVGAWDGSLILFPCQDMRTGYDCTNVNCTAGTKTTTQVWSIAGQTGTVYNVTFNVRGVVEAYAYVGGTRTSGTASISTNQNLFITGGTQQTAGNGNDYNTYELDVAPGATGAAKDVYYLNSVISSENPHTSTVTQHKTFPINYSATIKVPGGSKVTFTSYDSNCALVQNCAAQVQNTCSMPRTVSLAGTDPAAPTSFMQPYQAPVGSYGQWIFFDVTSVQ